MHHPLTLALIPFVLLFLCNDVRGIKAGLLSGGAKAKVFGQDLDVILQTPQYLDGLVKDSVAKTDNQIGKIINVRVHSAASTTINSILFRYAARHGKQIYVQEMHEGFKQFANSGVFDFFGRLFSSHKEQTADISYYFLSDDCLKHSCLKISWKDVVDRLSQEVPGGMLVTEMREPSQRLLSRYTATRASHYRHDTQDKILTHLSEDLDQNANALRNLQAAEYGIPQDASEEFVHKWARRFITHGHHSFDFIFIVERFEESLALFARICKWDIIDVLYLPLLDSSGMTEGYVKPEHGSFQGHRAATPRMEDLPEKWHDMLERATQLDRILYKAASAKLNILISKHFPVIQEFHDDVAAIHHMRMLWQTRCSKSDAKDKSFGPACHWFALPDHTGTHPGFQWPKNQAGFEDISNKAHGRPMAVPFSSPVVKSAS